MKVRCPNCGERIVVNGLGRKPFNMPVTEVCDALQLYRSVLAAVADVFSFVRRDRKRLNYGTIV